MRSIILICFINDPFDPPGAQRIGGGHLVLRELAAYLVSEGFDVTHVTRHNDPSKPAFKEFGPRYRIHRVEVGPKFDLPPGDVGLLIDELEAATFQCLHTRLIPRTVLHSQYWISGEVCRRINRELRLRHVHHLLSLGRQKVLEGEVATRTDDTRVATEIRVFNAVDCIIAQCPTEASALLSLYPEIVHRRIAIIPHGLDPNVFKPQV